MYIFKENYRIDNLANKHTHEEDEIIFTTEHVENGNPTHFYKEDIHRNAKKNKETYPWDIECKDVIKNNGKNREQNVTIKALEDCMVKPSKDRNKDDTNVHNGHIRGKSKSNDRTRTDNSKRPVANFSKTNGF